MRKSVSVVVLGTGQMGSGIVRLLVRRQGVSLDGAYARRTGRQGVDVGTAAGLDEPLGIAVDGRLEALLIRTRPDVAVQATCSTLEDAEDEILACIRHGVNVVSIAEEVAFPAARSPSWAARVDRLATDHGVTVLGTGVNPGFVLDLLVIALTGVCEEVESIRASRVNDLSPYGPSVLRAQGVGLTPAAFRDAVDDGRVVGHFGFPQSIGMIATALGLQVDRIDEQRDPIVARVPRRTALLEVEAGRVAGCRHTAVAYRGDRPVITLDHPQQVDPGAEAVQTEDRIEIDGTPPVRFAGSPEIPGGTATVALAVNVIPRVLQAAPGLASMADLPVPAAPIGDVDDLLGDDGEDAAHG